MKKFTKTATPAASKEEAPTTPKNEGTNLEAIRCILRPPTRAEGPAVIAPGGVFEATPEQVKKLVGDKSARRTNKGVSTDKELDALHAIHVNKQRKAEKEHLEEVRRANT